MGISIVLLGLLSPLSAFGEFPSSPEILVEQLQEALSSRNLSAYAELFADDFVFTPPPGLDTPSLDRQQELDLMRRFFAGVVRFEAEVEILTQTGTTGESQLKIRWSVLALDENGDGHRLDIIRDLLLGESPSGWQILEWVDSRASQLPEGSIGSWLELRLAYAVQTTTIRDSSWGTLKRRLY